jgi:hypothetical protein
MNDPALDGGGDGLGTLANLQFVEDMLEVTLDGGLRQVESRLNFLVAAPCHYFAQDVEFARAERLRRVAGRELLGQPGGKIVGIITVQERPAFLAGMSISNHRRI